MSRRRFEDAVFASIKRAKEGRKLIARADAILKKVTRTMTRDERVRTCRYAGELKHRGLLMANGY